MLKSLIRDLGKSLRRATDPAGPAAEPLEIWRQVFPATDGAQREALFAELSAWIEQHSERKQGWTLRGDWRLRLNDLAGAEQDYRRALRIDPMSPSAQEGLGLTLMNSGRLEDAYLHLELAHKLAPMNGEVLNHWGLVALQMGNLADAQTKFERAVERDVRNPHAWHNLGLVTTQLGHPGKGAEYLERAIELKPDHGLAYSNIALAYRDAERLDDAVTAARRAVALKSDNARVWVVLGDVLIAAGEFVEAESALRRACELGPRMAGARIALGKLYTAWSRHAAAEKAYQDALELAPADPEAEGGLGQLHLLQGRFGSGWDLYESRKRTSTAPVRSFPFVEWQGEDLQGKTLLVHAEQGLGDIILFASCLPSVIAGAGHVVIEAPPKLARLFERSFPNASVVGRESADRSLDWLHGLPTVERHIAIGSLPRLLRRNRADFPDHRGYLSADPQRVRHWCDRVGALGPGRAIGIAWRGGLLRSGGVQRSLELAAVLEALRPLGARLVSLQYGQGVDAQIAAAAAATGMTVQHWGEALADQDEAAALTCALDGVLTVCSTQAHLTGALGRPGCVLVPASPNWRYGAAGPSMPWYPSLHLVRQTALDDWATPLAQARDWLLALQAS